MSRIAIAIALVLASAPAASTSTVDTTSRVIRANMSQFRACYLRELARKPGLEGNVTVRFTIRDDGSVAAATVRKTTLNDDVVEDCVIRHLETLKFPGDDARDVEFAFVFLSRGR